MTQHKFCNEKYCKRKVRKGGTKCSTCYSRVWRANNPMRAFYISQRSHAKSRGIPYNISFEDFEKWAVKYQLIGHTGTTKEAFQVDRINEDDPRGYHIDNIQKLTTTQNTLKEHERRKRKKLLDFCWQQPEHASWISKDIEELPETPF